MKSKALIIFALFVLPAALGYLFVDWLVLQEDRETKHYNRGETELVVSTPPGISLSLFKAGKGLSDVSPIPAFAGDRMWLRAGNYFLRGSGTDRPLYVPIPLSGYRCGPDEEGSYLVTIRPSPRDSPPRVKNELPEFIYIPSGNFLFGDRQNPHESHYVWLTGYFLAPYEVSNAEFREFVNASDGYSSDKNWTEQGRRWKSSARSHATALLTKTDPPYERFGQPDQPVTWVNWHEANAFCAWLTRKYGGSKWLFSLPTDAEWEKAARGPDNLDYSLSMTISDNEVNLYNWRKNSDAAETVVGIHNTPAFYRANRYGVYHMTGNVVEWTQSINRPFNREKPWAEDDRNRDDTPGLRTARGGSWYSASIAYLYIPYRDSFQPEHSSQDIGFRVVVKLLP